MIKKIRSFYGIKQDLLALYMSTTRSKISMAEGHKRPFNSTQNLRLYRLFLSIPEADVVREAIVKDLPVKESEQEMQKIIKKNRQQLERLHHKLDITRKEQQKAFNMLAGANALAEHKDDHDKGLIDIIRISAVTHFNKYSDKKCLRLEMEIASLEAQQQLLNSRLNK